MKHISTEVSCDTTDLLLMRCCGLIVRPRLFGVSVLHSRDSVVLVNYIFWHVMSFFFTSLTFFIKRNIRAAVTYSCCCSIVVSSFCSWTSATAPGTSLQSIQNATRDNNLLANERALLHSYVFIIPISDINSWTLCSWDGTMCSLYFAADESFVCKVQCNYWTLTRSHTVIN